MKTRRMRASDGDLFVVFWCPGCAEPHGPRVEGTAPGPMWTWNGDSDRPTFSPSVLVCGTLPITDEQHARIMAGEHVAPTPRVCHSEVQQGRIRFLNDCTHTLAGQTVEVPDWPEQA